MFSVAYERIIMRFGKIIRKIRYYKKVLINLFWANINSKKSLSNMWSLVLDRPLDINIDTVNQCVLRCVFCPNSKHRRERIVMDMELFNNICADYYELGGGR
ncbi:hypothetical protein AGMMS50276_29340 [Synergistales bacterium]|nr:hypothetical protein AGMMS50276_29340 [Synergistales bacterium]